MQKGGKHQKYNDAKRTSATGLSHQNAAVSGKPEGDEEIFAAQGQLGREDHVPFPQGRFSPDAGGRFCTGTFCKESIAGSHKRRVS